jgi:hypothetical protein
MLPKKFDRFSNVNSFPKLFSINFVENDSLSLTQSPISDFPLSSPIFSSTHQLIVPRHPTITKKQTRLIYPNSLNFLVQMITGSVNP